MSATCIIFFTETKQKTTCWLTSVSLFFFAVFFWGGVGVETTLSDCLFWLCIYIYYDMPAFPFVLGDFLSPQGIHSHVACHLSSVKSFGAWVLCCFLSKKRTFTCWRVCPFALEHQFASACWCELVRAQLLTVLWTVRAVQVVGLLCCNSSFFVAVGCFGDFFVLFCSSFFCHHLMFGRVWESPWYNCAGWRGVKHQLTYKRLPFGVRLVLLMASCPEKLLGLAGLALTVNFRCFTGYGGLECLWSNGFEGLFLIMIVNSMWLYFPSLGFLRICWLYLMEWGTLGVPPVFWSCVLCVLHFSAGEGERPVFFSFFFFFLFFLFFCSLLRRFWNDLKESVRMASLRNDSKFNTCWNCPSPPIPPSHSLLFCLNMIYPLHSSPFEVRSRW